MTERAKTDHEKLAHEIAVALFTNGFGDRADRLAMVCGEGQRPVQLGGWSLRGATLQIVDVLEREEYIAANVAQAVERAKAGGR